MYYGYIEMSNGRNAIVHAKHLSVLNERMDKAMAILSAKRDRKGFWTSVKVRTAYQAVNKGYGVVVYTNSPYGFDHSRIYKLIMRTTK